MRCVTRDEVEHHYGTLVAPTAPAWARAFAPDGALIPTLLKKAFTTDGR